MEKFEKRVIVIFGLITIIAIAFVIFIDDFIVFEKEVYNEEDIVYVATPVETFVPTPTPTPEPEDTLITLAFVGDAMVHGTQLKHDYDDDPKTYEFKPTFDAIKDTISRADFAVVNLETTISGPELGYSGYPNFNTPESFIEALQYCGFDMVGLANNHILDRREVGVERTLDNLEMLGMDNTGISLNEQDFYDYYIKDIEGIKVGIVAYTWKTTAVNTFEDKKHVLRFWNDKEQVKLDMQNMRELGCDYIIMMPHWGVEYSTVNSNDQLRCAEEFIGYGADAVIGSHPHVVQPAEMLTAIGEDGETREGFVAYSLGNFLANMRNRFNNSGVVLNLTLRKTPQGEVTLDEITYVPTLIQSTRIYKTEASDHVILPAGKYVHDEALLKSLDEEHQEKIVDAYNDICAQFYEDLATPLDE